MKKLKAVFKIEWDTTEGLVDLDKRIALWEGKAAEGVGLSAEHCFVLDI